MARQVLAAATLGAGIVDTMKGTYEDIVDRLPATWLGELMDLTLTTDLRETPFAYFKSPPPMANWIQGDPIPQGVFDSEGFTVPMYDWGRQIAWHVNDRMDDQIDGLFPMAQATGRSAAKLPHEFAMDVLMGTPRTLPSIPLAADGQALFAALAPSGLPRFGVTGGNLHTGNGVASVSAVQTDYYAVIQRWLQMETEHGERLLPEEMIAQGVVAIHGVHNIQVMEQAFLQKRIGVEITTSTTAATPSNLIQDASRNVLLAPDPRITDDRIIYALRAAPMKPLFLLTREPLKEYYALVDDNVSDRGRNTGEESVSFKTRQNVGVSLPYGLQKVSN